MVQLARRNHTLNHSIYETLREMIAAGQLVSGTRIDERAISEQLEVSRTPLREAIAKLAKEGLVEQRPYRGNFVRTFTAQQASDLYEVRKGLESMAVRLAVPRLTPRSTAGLQAIVADVGDALNRSDLVGYALADQRFHDMVAELSGNQTLIDLLSQLRGQVQLIRLMANRDPDVVESTAIERPAIVDAMAAGDAGLASRLMEEHIELVRRSITARLEEVRVLTASEPELVIAAQGLIDAAPDHRTGGAPV